MLTGLSTTGATMPPAGTVEVVPTPAAGGPIAPGAASGTEAEQERLLRQLISTLTQLIAIATAQAGAAGVAGGGGAPDSQPSPVTPESLRMAIAGGGLGGGASWHGAFTLEPAHAAPAPLGTVSGGGGEVTAVPGPVSASIGGGAAGPAWSIVGAAGAPVSIEATIGGVPSSGGVPVGVTGGGAAVAPQLDLRRLNGTPRPGGLVDVVLRSASTTAGASHGEGSWTVLTDEAGAQLQAHVHGAWARHPARIMEGIQRGYVAVHLHADGTLHLHDVIAT